MNVGYQSLVFGILLIYAFEANMNKRKSSFLKFVLDFSLNGICEFLQMVVLVAGGYSYTGAKANINVWNPYV